MVGTFSGNITGPAKLVQNGPGTTVLTGSNSYSGGTTSILAGVLQGNSGSQIPSSSMLNS